MKFRLFSVCTFLIFLLFLYFQKSKKGLTRADRLCIQSEWKYNPTIKETSDHGNSFFVAFGDIQKNVDWLHLPEINTTENSEILMIVISRSDNFSRRNVIRNTWMNKVNSKVIREGRMKALFLVGTVPEDQKTTVIVMDEAKLFGDMVVVDIKDHYRGLTYKTIAALLYATSKTPKIQLIGKIDEDVILFPEELEALVDQKVIVTSSISLYGEIVEAGGRVNHDKSQRWYVPESTYRCPKYPSCLSGPFYLATREAAVRILSATKHRNFISKPAENEDRILAWHSSKSDAEFVEFFNRKLEKRVL